MCVLVCAFVYLRESVCEGVRACLRSCVCA